LLGTGLLAIQANSADQEIAAAPLKTATQIKHVIVVIARTGASITSTPPMSRRAQIRS